MGALERWDLSHVGQAWYELGEIALRRGDLGEARRNFGRAEEYGKTPLPGSAALQIAEGDASLATAALTAACIDAGDGDPLAVAELVPVLVEAEAATGDLAAARRSVEPLTDLAETFGTVILQAQVAVGAARLALAEGELDEARGAARRAIVTWRDAGLPYETAQAQHLLADAAYRAGDPAAAIEVGGAPGRSAGVPDVHVHRSRRFHPPRRGDGRRTMGGHRDLVDLDVEPHPFEPFASRVWELRHSVSPYDAWYLSLAERRDVPLATLDRRLTRTAGARCEFAAPPS